MDNKDLERYLLRKKLGEGGFGEVYLAEDTLLARQVAIKAVPRGNLAFHEARLLAQLSHQNIVGIYDFVEGTNCNYLVMEYIPGKPITDQRYCLATLIDLAIQICNGLEYAHSQGIWHRDIKPSNLLVTAQGLCVITDFGIASNGTGSEQIRAGTPRYVAPEQLKGGDIDSRVDVYGLGQVISVLIEINSLEIPTKLGKVLARATQRRAELRYSSIQEFRQALIAVSEMLATYNRLEQVMPDLGDGWQVVQESAKRIKGHLPLSYLTVIIPPVAFLWAAYAPLTDPTFYSETFVYLIAPLLLGLVGFFSLSLCSVVYGVILLPTILVTFPVLGWTLAFLWVLTLPLTLRYPQVFFAVILAATIGHPIALLTLALVMAFHFGVISGTLTGLVLAIIQYTSPRLPETYAYQRWLTAASWSQQNWTSYSLEQLELQQLWELVTLTNGFFTSAQFHQAVFALLLATMAGLVIKRCRLGIHLTMILGSVLAWFWPGVQFWHWGVAITISYLWVLAVRSSSVSTTKPVSAPTKEIKKGESYPSSGRVLL